MENLSLLEIKKKLSPTEWSHFLQSKGEVFYWERGDFWVVTDLNLAKKVLSWPEYSADRSKFFMSRMPDLDLRLIGDFFRIVKNMMVMSDDAKHAARRGIMQSVFAPRFIKTYVSLVQNIVDHLLGEKISGDKLDFARDIAPALPSLVLADLFCVPEQDRVQFFIWSNEMTAFFGGASAYQNEDGVRVNKAAQSLYNYFSSLIERRRHAPGGDFLSQIVVANEKYGLTDEELVSQAIMMLVAGQVTTSDQLCHNMFALTAYGNKLGEVPEDKLVDAIEECNRLDPAVTFLFRSVRVDTDLGGYRLLSGDTVFIANHAVNRDPSVFENPNEFDWDRKAAQHFAYGHGAHYCLGARLARIQMGSLFLTLKQRYREVVPLSSERWHYSLAFSGFKELVLQLR